MNRQCQICKRRKAVWIVGSDGFGAKKGAAVCDAYACRSEASNGYPVTFTAVAR